MGSDWPSIKARAMLSLLQSQLGYRVVRQSGSHRRLVCDGRPPLTFAFHDGDTVSPRLVRVILVQQVGLSMDEAREVLRNA
ncbi:type II toxin-antitoxin system HicA family toxin [Micromonospora sp. HSS6-12]|uniref:Type II toxin-antitoxin system HicA family toxin n=2 Tax=Micromonospora thermarum TaxID=2720024 RepID=A0ABX0Z7A6_9ACTN|nr:type II toxin-antitoxin system HicA family toxin [Micromonospora thermarum]